MFNTNTRIQFLQSKNIIQMTNICENGHEITHGGEFMWQSKLNNSDPVETILKV